MTRSMLAGLTSAVVLTCSGCSGTPPEGSTRYATTPDLAAAMRTQQIKDGSLSFTFTRSGSDGEGVAGNGTFVIRSDGTDLQEKISSTGRNSYSAEMISLGSDVYVRRDANTSWTKPAAPAVANPFVTDGFWFTNLDQVSDVFALTGSSSILIAGRPAVEYRLTADAGKAHARLAERLGQPAAATVGAAADPLELTLTLDSDTRLHTAAWNEAGGGKKTTTEYDFNGWGDPAKIVAPTVD